jgi:hypothetical protein
MIGRNRVVRIERERKVPVTNTLSDLTLAGDLTMDANNITMTGDLASSDARVANGWFTNLNVTNPITASFVDAATSDGVAVQGRTNGTAYPAGYVGETIINPMPGSGDNMSSTVSISSASPTVVTYSSHGLSTGAGVNFTTGGALPNGLSVGVNYYIIRIDNNSFWLATSVANAFAGAKINTTGSQSGTHTCNVHVLCTSGSYVNANGILLTPGLWLVDGTASVNPIGGGTLTAVAGQITVTSGTSTPFGNTGFMAFGGISVSGGAGAIMPTGTRIFNVSANTLLFGIVRGNFASGGGKGCCSLTAIRVA